MKFSIEDLKSMERRKRALFLNAVSGVKSANLIGTKNSSGNENLAIINSLFHLGANPALLGFIQRPTTVERHGFENMLETGYYTLNAVAESFVDKAHQTAANYSREESEFTAVGLEPIYLDDFQAPFVKESPLQIAMKLEQVIPIELNGTKLVIGSIQCIHSSIELEEDGYFDLSKSEIVGISGLDTYLKTQKIARFSYAKPNENLKLL
jgi:flavin reductase (DIM6/NTAB) family NADH-FMN oxidoreductase RutF